MSLEIHSTAICQTTQLGKRTRIGPFAHIQSEVCLGDDCQVSERVFIDNNVLIGNRVTLESGVVIAAGVRIADHVYIGSNATFATVPSFSTEPSRDCIITTLEEGCSVGANSTILPGVTIGRNALVQPGAVVARNVPPNAVVTGNPAQIISYRSDQTSLSQSLSSPGGQSPNLADVRVNGVTLHRLPSFEDIRGNLVAAEIPTLLPFRPLRFFFVHHVPSSEIRGEHAHKQCHQFLICIAGSIHVVVDDGKTRQEIALDRSDVGLYLKPMVWGVQYQYTQDAVLLVFASHPYDPDDYIRDYGEWLGVLRDAER